MGRKRQVTIDGLADAINDILSDYVSDITEAIDPVLRKAAQTGRAELRANSPKRTGKYAKGWQYKKIKSGGTVGYVVHNGTHPGLTHLLEEGHVTRNGTSRVPGRPHIAPIGQQVTEKIPDEVKREIQSIR